MRCGSGAMRRHRRVMVLREQEGDAEIGERLLGGRAGAVEVEAERFERVGGAGLATRRRGCRAWRPARRRPRRRGATAVETLSVWCAVAAGAADVDRVRRAPSIGIMRARSARGGLGDLDAGLAALGQRDQEVGDRLVATRRRRGCRRRPGGALARSSGERGVGQQGERRHASSRTGDPGERAGSWRASRGRARWRCFRGGTARRGSAASRGGSP